jgi:hypothetical protein
LTLEILTGLWVQRLETRVSRKRVHDHHPPADDPG